MRKYIENFIEEPNAVFGGLPVCPFARPARMKDDIEYRVVAFDSHDPQILRRCLLPIFHEYQRGPKQALMIIHPHPEAVRLEDLELLEKELNTYVKPLGYVVDRGHPEDDFQIGGIFTRRDPYPNFLFVPLKDIVELRKGLPARYYEQWSKEALREDEIHRN
jgi:hypothetical protein